MAAPKNHKSGKSDKIWRDAIMRAVNRISKDGKTKHLEILANRLVLRAAEGDVGALKEIGDRMDGRPTQSIGLGQAEDLEPIDIAIRPILTREAWLALHSK